MPFDEGCSLLSITLRGQGTEMKVRGGERLDPLGIDATLSNVLLKIVYADIVLPTMILVVVLGSFDDVNRALLHLLPMYS